MQPTGEFGEFTLARCRRLAQLFHQVSYLHAVTRHKASSDLLSKNHFKKKPKINFALYGSPKVSRVTWRIVQFECTHRPYYVRYIRPIKIMLGQCLFYYPKTQNMALNAARGYAYSIPSGYADSLLDPPLPLLFFICSQSTFL